MDPEIARHLARLDAGWTVHVRPRLGLERPDLVLTHDRFGVCAIEVRGWTATTHRVGPTGSLEEKVEGGWKRAPHPCFEAARIRSVLYDRYYAQPGDDVDPSSVVRAAVILPRCSTEYARGLLANPVAPPAEREVPVWGADALADNFDAILLGDGCTVPASVSMRRLAGGLVDSGPRPTTSTPSVLTPAAHEVAENPAGASMRRARGPAGSGKSYALAARAAALAAEGREVLALSFSVTMANHLRDLVNLQCGRLGADPTLILCANFHSFCEQAVGDAEQLGIDAMRFPGKRFADSIVATAMHVFTAGYERRFDAVLIDEGQDFALSWWNLLRERVVAPGGEMLLMTDQRQDVYGRSSWNDEATCAEAGLTHPWIELTGSQRLPTDIRRIADHFAESHLFGADEKHPFDESGQAPIELSLHVPSVGRWQNINGPTGLGREIGREVVRLLRSHPDLDPRDVVFLCEYHHDGADAVAEIEAAGFPVHHVFSRDPDDPRRGRRYRLWPAAEAVTGCTMHSFKGWGCRALVMGIGVETRSKPTAYISMTRVAVDPAGRPSFLSVVNADRRVADFEAEFATLSASPRPVVPWGPPDAAQQVG